MYLLNIYNIYLYKKGIYYKELTHKIMKAEKSKICSVGKQAGDPGEPVVWMKSKGSVLENSLSVREAGLFRSIQALN